MEIILTNDGSKYWYSIKSWTALSILFLKSLNVSLKNACFKGTQVSELINCRVLINKAELGTIYQS